ncbi:type VI secretion system lipoprotein IglE [Francisella tularensis]|uniref:type VI secretion system lipoprotein IglE n=1 Tax=Francisella tularensis TaxID=263 RepID=UPI0002EF7F37|nr:type VI secretion system lipoprotein IglE [Francisella tularensis]
MYNKLLKNLCLVLSTIIGLSSCISDGLYINNNIPKTKIVLESKPDKNIFYSDNYQSISQRIYDDNVKVLNLKIGKNEFPLDKDIKDYALYFILPENKKTENWKYLISSDSVNKFTIKNDSSIEKD